MNLHTRSNTPVQFTGTSVSISTRSEVMSYFSTNSIAPNSNLKSDSKIKSMSQVNKSSAMLHNLEMGLEYTNHQYANLSEIDKLFALMSKEGFFRNEKTFQDYTGPDIIFADSLRHLSNKRFSHIPLFGIGDESPVRIHLNFKRGREVYLIKPIPLLSAPAFSSFLKSGLNGKKPDSQFLSSILQEILSFMIMVSNNSKEITALIEEVTINSNRIAQLNSTRADTVKKTRYTFLNKLIQCISFG